MFGFRTGHPWLSAGPPTIPPVGKGEREKREMTETKTRFWTIAWRKPRANRFHRATDLATDWHTASAVAAAVSHLRPDLEVWYVPTKAAEESGYVSAEDVGNILVSSGRRVRIVDDGKLADIGQADILASVN
ncbi:hypothetical protein SEA_MORI_121 [Mycobacterium phage Mori]|nr:hypothetical protein SEA_MORI_121 [Mycobacterium phage Mori]